MCRSARKGARGGGGAAASPVFSRTTFLILLFGRKNCGGTQGKQKGELPLYLKVFYVLTDINSAFFDKLIYSVFLQMKQSTYTMLSMKDEFDGKNPKKPAKSYAAWLAWYRSTINSEDYYKYISNKV